MTTIAHVLSASYISLKVANVTPVETDLLAISLLSAGILDLDHLFYIVKDHKFYKKSGYGGNLHKARSFLHELPGLFFSGVIMFVVSFFNTKLALVLGLPFMIHLIEDMLMGISIPFSPIDKTEIHLIKQQRSIKIIVDILVIIIFGFLWIKYLSGQI